MSERTERRCGSETSSFESGTLYWRCSEYAASEEMSSVLPKTSSNSKVSSTKDVGCY